MTIGPNFLFASINFDDFQHFSVSYMLITFVCWKEHTFSCAYDLVTLCLNCFYFYRSFKQGNFLLICESILEILLCSCMSRIRIIRSLNSRNYESNLVIILKCIISNCIDACVEHLKIKSKMKHYAFAWRLKLIELKI